MPKPPHTNPPPSMAPPPRQALRLRRDDTNTTDAADGTENLSDQSYKFPAAEGGRVARAGRGGSGGCGRRLVAATVAEAPVERTFEGSPCAVLNGGDDPDCLGRIVSSGQLVKEIETTLDRMQSRLTRFRADMDRAFQFPVPCNSDLPPAA